MKSGKSISVRCCTLLLLGGCAGRAPAREPTEVRVQCPVEPVACECVCHRDRGNQFWKEGNYEQALGELTFCVEENLPNLMGLAEEYPPARRAVEKFQAEVVRRIRPPSVDDQVTLLIDVNSALRDYTATAKVFELWKPYEDASRRALQLLIWRQLVLAGQYRDALEFSEDIEESHQRTRDAILQLDPSSADARDLIDYYAWSASAQVVALVGSGDPNGNARAAMRSWREVASHGATSRDFCTTVREETELVLRSVDRPRADSLRGDLQTLSACGAPPADPKAPVVRPGSP